MKRISQVFFPLMLVLFIVVLWNTQGTTASDLLMKKQGKPIAVLELFTSEGCSSCPPADRMVSRLLSRARRKGLPIYPLSFHVDYWDKLGWKDPYSQKRFTTRQSHYMKAFGAKRVYTPQVVVNGRMHFVGNHQQKIESAVSKELKVPSKSTISLDIKHKKSQKTLTIRYNIKHKNIFPTQPIHLHIALVERGLVSSVKRGENAQRTLFHNNVVRVFKTIRVGKHLSGSTSIKIPNSVVLENSSIIAYLQHPKTMRILGATSHS